MFHHVATFRFKSGVTSEDVDRLTRDLRTLAGDLDGLVSYACGSDLGLRRGSESYAVAAVFDTVDALASYLSHPQHLEIVRTHVSAMVEEKHSVQFAAA
ncbi:MAG: Dabb family protein [Nocardioides sp.]